jgi:hypothetical protein
LLFIAVTLGIVAILAPKLVVAFAVLFVALAAVSIGSIFAQIRRRGPF